MGMTELTLMGATIRRVEPFADDVPIEQLLPSMVGLAGDGPYRPGGWLLATSDGSAVDPGRTLADLSLRPEDMLLVAQRVAAIGSDLSVGGNRAGKSAASATAIPPRLGTVRRVLTTISALFGLSVPRAAEDLGPLERARSAWRWSCHANRLDWLIGRNRLRRTMVVAVGSLSSISHPTNTSSDVALRLADRLADVRRDRVAVVDGGLQHAILTSRIRRVDTTVEDLGRRSRWATEDIDARFAAPATPARPMIVGMDRTRIDRPSVADIRTAIDRLRPHAAIIILDVGQIASAGELSALADQIVIAADGPAAGVEADRIVGHRPCIVVDAGGGLDALGLSRLVSAAIAITGDDSSDVDRRMALALVDGWRQLSALVDDPAEVVWDV